MAKFRFLVNFIFLTLVSFHVAGDLSCKPYPYEYDILTIGWAFHCVVSTILDSNMLQLCPRF